MQFVYVDLCKLLYFAEIRPDFPIKKYCLPPLQFYCIPNLYGETFFLFLAGHAIGRVIVIRKSNMSVIASSRTGLRKERDILYQQCCMREKVIKLNRFQSILIEAKLCSENLNLLMSKAKLFMSPLEIVDSERRKRGQGDGEGKGGGGQTKRKWRGKKGESGGRDESKTKEEMGKGDILRQGEGEGEGI